MIPQLEFKTCPDCHGYGVRDSGLNCKTCGGEGRGGINGDGVIGSGEIMFDKATGERITSDELARRLKESN